MKDDTLWGPFLRLLYGPVGLLVLLLPSLWVGFALTHTLPHEVPERYQKRFTSRVLTHCAPDTLGCTRWDSCADMEPRDVKAPQELVSAKVDAGYIICEWRDK